MKKLGVLFALVVLTSASAFSTVWNVNVADFQFTPANLTILQGDTVIWTNTVGFHSVTPDCSPALFAQPAAAAPWTYQFVFNVPIGSYPYHCEIHPDMMATISVQDRGTWNVTVRNAGYTPQNITITRGDTVVWTNVEGFHNVHDLGTPSRFGNALANAPWTYTFIFDESIPLGSYTYECSAHHFQGHLTILLPASLAVPAELVSYSDNTGSQVQLWWKSVCGAAGYSVFRSPDVTLPVYPDSLGFTTDTTFTDATSSGRAYYLVRALTP